MHKHAHAYTCIHLHTLQVTNHLREGRLSDTPFVTIAAVKDTHFYSTRVEASAASQPPAAAHMSASTSAAAAASGGEGMPLSDGVPGGAQSKSARISPDVPSTQLSRERLFHNGPHPKRASRSTAVVDLVDVKPHEPPSKRKPQSATPLLSFGHHFQEDKSAKMMLGLTSTSDFDAFPLVLGHSFDRGSFFSVEMAQKFDNDATPTSLVLLPDCAVALQSVCRSSLIY
jgi:hypothetical protein